MTIAPNSVGTEPGTIIRSVTVDDVPELSVMGTRFVRLASYGRHMLVPKEEIAIGLRQLLQAGAVGWVAVSAGAIVGVILGAIGPVWWAPSIRVAGELAWWMNEDHRKGMTAVRLLRLFEEWARDQGARFVSMSELCIDGKWPVEPLLQRTGYVLVERAHIKRL